MNKEIFIYGLIEPKLPFLEKHVRYVGKTANPNLRLKQHISKSYKPKNKLYQWISSFLPEKVQILILETCTSENWQEREDYWIKKLSSLQLLNIMPGGLAPKIIPFTQERRLKQSENAQKRKLSNASKLRISQSKKGLKLSLETRLKMKLAHQFISTETRKKMSDAHKGKIKSPEHRLKISLALTGKKRTPEQCFKNSLAHLGHKHSEEAKEKMRNAWLKRKSLIQGNI